MSSTFHTLKKKIINDLKQKKIENIDHWQQYLVSLYIIRKTDGICLFSHHFNLGYISNIENQLVGMGFIAIANMMQEVVDSNSQLRMIDLGRKKVLLEAFRIFLNHGLGRMRLLRGSCLRSRATGRLRLPCLTGAWTLHCLQRMLSTMRIL